MNDTIKMDGLVGEAVDPPADTRTREQKIADYQEEHRAAFQAAVNAPHEACCTPSARHMRIIESYRNPPID
jgi:hypothetical protein